MTKRVVENLMMILKSRLYRIRLAFYFSQLYFGFKILKLS